MFNFPELVDNAVAKFLANFFDQLISFFANILVNVMGSSLKTLDIPLVQNGIKYAQALAFTILVIKAMAESIQTYILYQKGDPESDPTGLVVRTAQATAVIACMPWIVRQMFIFGTKVATDVANLSSGQTGIADWTFLTEMIIVSGGSVVALFFIVIIIFILLIAIQATIRGAELALVSVIGPILALNITANNQSTWSAWFKQLIIVCLTQALQIFMFSGTMSLLTSQVISSEGLIQVIGWLWVALKTPKFIQQFAHSTGFSGAVGGTAKQAGSFYLMRQMMGS